MMSGAEKRYRQPAVETAIKCLILQNVPSEGTVGEHMEWTGSEPVWLAFFFKGSKQTARERYPGETMTHVWHMMRHKKIINYV